MSQFIADVAGTAATVTFIASTIPMLVKAFRTKDLSSYSGAHLVGANVGNVAQAIYVATLRPGPIWILHGFNTAASAAMLAWWCCYRLRATAPSTDSTRRITDWERALDAVASIAERRPRHVVLTAI